MEDYNPDIEPDPALWNELEESERLDLCTDYVMCFEDEVNEDTKTIHAIIHGVVENQLAEGYEPTLNAYSRLIKELDRHEVIHAIGAVIATEIYEILQGSDAEPGAETVRRLNRLTVKRWKNGKY
jgi:hypothetical protein